MILPDEKVISLELNLKPQTGAEDHKIAATLSLRLLFTAKFPQKAPVFELTASKGLDDD